MTPFASRRAQRSTLSWPATTYFITSSVAGSVKRRPATMRVSRPRRLLERGRLRPAAVDDGDAVPAVDERAQVPRDDVEVRRVDDLAAELQDDGLHGGHGPGSASEAISSRPSMRFMFWIACPAPPFTRLSVGGEERDGADAGARGARDRRRPRRSSSPRPPRPRAAGGAARARTARPRTPRGRARRAAPASTASGELDERGREDAAPERRRDRDEPEREVPRAGGGERLLDLRARAGARAACTARGSRRGPGGACPAEGAAPEPDDPVIPWTWTTPSRSPARASGRSASSIVVAKQPGAATSRARADRVAVQLGQAVDERGEQLGARVNATVVPLVRGRVLQPEVAAHVDDLAGPGSAASSGTFVADTPCGSPSRTTSTPRAASAGGERLEDELGPPLEGGIRGGERLADEVDRRDAHELDVGVEEEAPDELGAAVPGAADHGGAVALARAHAPPLYRDRPAPCQRAARRRSAGGRDADARSTTRSPGSPRSAARWRTLLARARRARAPSPATRPASRRSSAALEESAARRAPGSLRSRADRERALRPAPRASGAPPTGAPVFLVGHADTVFPPGTFEGFRRRGRPRDRPRRLRHEGRPRR